MLDFERRVENWLVEVICMVLDILMLASVAVFSIAETWTEERRQGTAVAGDVFWRTIQLVIVAIVYDCVRANFILELRSMRKSPKLCMMARKLHAYY